jgi:hypothetical protein
VTVADVAVAVVEVAVDVAEFAVAATMTVAITAVRFSCVINVFGIN